MIVSAIKHPGSVSPEIACNTAVTVVHIVAGAILNTQLEIVLPMGVKAIGTCLLSEHILPPPLLPQLQSRLLHLSSTFTELVCRFGKSALRKCCSMATEGSWQNLHHS